MYGKLFDMVEMLTWLMVEMLYYIMVHATSALQLANH